MMTKTGSDGGRTAPAPYANEAASGSGAGPPALERDLREQREQRERLARAVVAADVGIWEYQLATHTFTLDQIERRLLGIENAGHDVLTEDTVLAAVADQDRDRVRAALRGAAANGHAYDESFRVHVGGDMRWVHSVGRALESGGSARLVGVSFDTTAEREALAARELLLSETNHRIKNLFAVIGAMTALCAREATSARDLADDLGNRIAAMGRAHALTQHMMIERALELHELIEAVIAPTRTRQSVTIEGPPIIVPLALVTPLALIFHEWATNATKYGALSYPDGSLSVRWTIDDAGLAVIDWREVCHDLPDGAASGGTGKPGFGTRLIEATVAQLRARLSGEQRGGVLTRRIEIAGLG